MCDLKYPKDWRERERERELKANENVCAIDYQVEELFQKRREKEEEPCVLRRKRKKNDGVIVYCNRSGILFDLFEL